MPGEGFRVGAQGDGQRCDDLAGRGVEEGHHVVVVEEGAQRAASAAEAFLDGGPADDAGWSVAAEEPGEEGVRAAGVLVVAGAAVRL